MTSPWPRRAAILGIMLFVGLVAYWLNSFFVAAPIARESQRAADLEAEHAALLERRQSVARELAATPAEPVATGATLDAATADLAAILLQQIVRDGAEANGGQITLIQSAVSPAADGLAAIRLMLRARFDELALLGLLRQLEYADVRIVVTSLDLQPGRRPGDTMLETSLVASAFHAAAH